MRWIMTPLLAPDPQLGGFVSDNVACVETDVPDNGKSAEAEVAASGSQPRLRLRPTASWLPR